MSLTVAHALPSHYPRCSEDSQQTGSVSDASVKSKPDFNLEEDCDVFDVVLVPGKVSAYESLLSPFNLTSSR